jgi:hypothetical protein
MSDMSATVTLQQDQGKFNALLFQQDKTYEVERKTVLVTGVEAHWVVRRLCGGEVINCTCRSALLYPLQDSLYSFL